MAKIEKLLKLMIEKNASDLHLKSGSYPLLRIHGDLIPQTSFQKLTSEEVRDMIGEITTSEQKLRFDENRELDFAYTLQQNQARFRINVYLQKGVVGSAIRLIPAKIPTLDDLKFPPVIKELCLKPRGLVLVTGPTGSGKSTTLAAMIDYINSNRKCHIMTVEDPIEFVHSDRTSIINQRELGSDTLSFVNALRHALRQDPDVILVGEMRDLETIRLAVTAAETGHLVLSTLHTIGATGTIERIIDVFPPEQQRQIIVQLSTILEGVISQILLPRADGKGRIAALEIMTGTPAVRNLIRENKPHQILYVIQTSGSLGMQTLDMSLKSLYNNKVITLQEALSKCTDPENFKKMIL